jgi:hypothetical protein
VWGPYPIAVWFFLRVVCWVDAVCVCYWSFCHPPTPLCTEAPDPPPEHYAFLYSRPHVSENGGLGFKVVWQSKNTSQSTA